MKSYNSTKLDDKVIEKILSKPIPQNIVVRELRDFNGNLFGFIWLEHSGSPESMVNSAEKITKKASLKYSDFSHINSRIIVTENGQIKWSISPNFKHIAEIGTDEFGYILGEI